MPKTIDIPLWNGWHVTIFQPAFWMLIIAALVLAFVAMKLWRAHS